VLWRVQEDIPALGYRAPYCIDAPRNAATINLQTVSRLERPRLSIAPATLADVASAQFGDLTPRSVSNNSPVRSALFETTSSTQHAATIYQAGTSGVDVAAALNV
jgi:hypothetical protein